MPVALLVHGFEIAQRRLAARAPVDDVAAAIDQPFVVEAQKRFQNRAIQRRIQREFLARPVARIAQADHLLLDGAAALRLPFPYAPLELFAADRFAREVFLGQFALDHHLRGDPGMIHARQPQRALAAHAVPAREHVDLRVLQHVPDVDLSGHVRRRNDDGKCLARPLRIGAKEFLLHPGLGPARLDQLRVVGLGELLPRFSLLARVLIVWL